MYGSVTVALEAHALSEEVQLLSVHMEQLRCYGSTSHFQ